jgi:hypothetical protein
MTGMRHHRPLYPELYPELEGRGRKAKGFIMALAGSFIFIVTTLGTVMLTSQFLYLGVAGLSLGSIALTYTANRSRSVLYEVLLIISASGALAVEAGLVAIYFPVAAAGTCAVLTLGGCLIAARGIHDIESIAQLEPLPQRRREITVEHGGQ